MATQDVNAPALAAQGEPCPECAAALAGDQRYCLECGVRRGGARIAFRDILAAPSASAPPTSIASAAGSPARSSVTLPFLIGLGCLLLALGVGVLIGRAGDDPQVTAPAPQVITVGGGAAATTPSDAASSESTGGASDAPDKGGSASDAGSSGSKATNDAIKQDDSLSGDAYQKKSSNLPKEVGTGGKAPPKDNEPAGGGTDFQEIG